MPQGAILSPTLFNIYTTEIISKNYVNIPVMKYADYIGYSMSMNNSKSLG